jgi:hypothetical protein
MCLYMLYIKNRIFGKEYFLLKILILLEDHFPFFRLYSSVYTQKHLINKFGSVYANASEKALET